MRNHRRLRAGPGGFAVRSGPQAVTGESMRRKPQADSWHAWALLAIAALLLTNAGWFFRWKVREADHMEALNAAIGPASTGTPHRVRVPAGYTTLTRRAVLAPTAVPADARASAWRSLFRRDDRQAGGWPDRIYRRAVLAVGVSATQVQRIQGGERDLTQLDASLTPVLPIPGFRHKRTIARRELAIHASPTPRQPARQERRRPASLGTGDLVRRSLRYDGAASSAGTGSDVDHPVRLHDSTHVVFDHHHRVPGINQPLQLDHQPVRVGRMQACGGFVQDVERPSTLAALQFGGQLDALCFTA